MVIALKKQEFKFAIDHLEGTSFKDIKKYLDDIETPQLFVLNSQLAREPKMDHYGMFLRNDEWIKKLIKVKFSFNEPKAQTEKVYGSVGLVQAQKIQEQFPIESKNMPRLLTESMRLATDRARSVKKARSSILNALAPR